MPVSGKVLEDSIRLSRIRNIKRTLYLVQAVMLVIMGILLIVIVGGAKVRPNLYLPMASFLGVLALLMLIISVESFFFRMLEIKFARSSSARHLMAKNSMRRAIVLAIIAGAVSAILTVPPIISGIEGGAERTLDVSPSAPPYFYSSDPFDLMRSGMVEIAAVAEVEIYLVDEGIFDEFYRGFTTTEFLSAMSTYRLNSDNFVVEPSIPLTIEVPIQGFMKYYLVLNDFGYGINARATIIKEVSGTFTGFTAMLLLALVVANVAWFAYLIPVERKYSSGSIYR